MTIAIAVDFDGTIVEHCYPDIGPPVPGALQWLRAFQRAGALLILWTMRSDSDKEGPVLTEAVDFCRANGIEFWGVNHNPTQSEWTSSPKAYAKLYIDDAAFGCPLRESITSSRPSADWDKIGPRVMDYLTKGRTKHTSEVPDPATHPE